MDFKARTKAPSSSAKLWIHTSKNGLNECLKISSKTGSCIPNCVGYAWGRFYEILGQRPKLCKANAEMWYGYKDGYKRGKTPKVGAVVCWAKGKVGDKTDGAGHVAIVEEVYSDGSFLTSNSGYNSTRFYMKKIGADCELKGYKFQGFIYNPAVEITVPVKPDKEDKPTYTSMKVVAKSGMKLRSGAGTEYKLVGSVKSGGSVKVVKKIKEDDEAWAKLTGGEYICISKGDKVYVK